MDSPRKAEDKLNNSVIVTVGIVGTLVVWGSIVALQAYYDSTAGQEEQRREIAGQSDALRSLNAQSWQAMGEYRAKGGTSNRIAIPIELAMKLVVRDRKKASLVPVVGSHDKPTYPAVVGRPSDRPTVPAPATGTAPTTPAPGASSAPAVTPAQPPQPVAPPAVTPKTTPVEKKADPE